MAINAGNVYSQLILDMSKYEQGLKKAEQQMNTFTGKMTKIGNGMNKAGKSLSKYVTLPIVGAGAAATKLGTDFEAAMSRVQAISGATGTEMDRLNKTALDLGAKTKFSASEVASAMENLASAGFNVTEIMGSLPGMLDLAAASGTDLSTATDIAASTLRGFQLDASQAGHVADVFTEAANRTNAQVEDMGEAMKYIAPVANAMGMSLEETAAAVGILADAGIKGSQAGTTLRGALTRLTKPTKQMQEVMNELGLEFFDAQGNMKPLAEIIAELEEGTKGLTQEQKNQALATLFGQEALSGMLVLTEEGPDALEELTKGFENSSGAAEEAADIMMNNTKGAIEEMLGALETAGIKIFKIVAPAITDLAKKVGELADKFSALPKETQENIIKFAALAAAIGPVLSIGGKLAGRVSSIIGLFGKSAAATTAATAAVSPLATGIGGVGLAAKTSALLMNPWALAIAGGGVAAYGLYKHLSEEAIPQVDIFGDKVSESTKKAVGGFMELNEQATLQLNQMAWSGQTVTSTMANNLITTFNEMGNQILTSMRQKQQTQLTDIQNFFNSSNALSTAQETQVLTKLQAYNGKQQQIVIDGEARIKEILNTAKSEKRALKGSERQEINSIQQQMANTAVEVMSQSEVEQEAILERLRSNASTITARQAAQVVQNSAKQREKTIQNANEQYVKVKAQIKYLRDDAKVISSDQAKALIKDAKKQKDETVKKAEEMHNKVVKEAKKQSGEHVDEVDWETGEVKSKWKVMYERVTGKNNALGRNSNKTWNGVSDDIREATGEIDKWNNKKAKNKTVTFTQRIRIIGDKILSGLGIGRNARGTDYWRGGLTWIGEQGPELIELPRGSKVYSNQKSRQMVKDASGGITQKIIINSPKPLSPSEIARKNLQVSRQLAMEWGL